MVLIGEIRDPETLALARECALNGLLVLTALHTRDAAAAGETTVEEVLRIAAR